MPSNGGAKLNFGPIHNNSNLTCAIAIRMGGEDPGTSDLLEVSFLPLDCKYDLHTEFKLFQVKMRPAWRVNRKVAKLNNDNIKEFEESPFDQVAGLSLFTKWVDTLHLKTHKKIIPLVWDWSTIKLPLQLWMGEETFDYYISENHRELKSVMNFMNDRSDFWGDNAPFVSDKFSGFLTRLNVDLIEKNSTSADCKAMIDANKLLLRNYIPGYATK